MHLCQIIMVAVRLRDLMHDINFVARQRENFQIEGPTGVMKQLESLWKIMELSDTELFEHLSAIGAESLHFAFRMLLVLFRRELSFEESLSMWEVCQALPDVIFDGF